MATKNEQQAFDARSSEYAPKIAAILATPLTAEMQKMYDAMTETQKMAFRNARAMSARMRVHAGLR